MASSHRAQKQWCLGKNETVTSFEDPNWTPISPPSLSKASHGPKRQNHLHSEDSQMMMNRSLPTNAAQPNRKQPCLSSYLVKLPITAQSFQETQLSKTPHQLPAFGSQFDYTSAFNPPGGTFWTLHQYISMPMNVRRTFTTPHGVCQG